MTRAVDSERWLVVRGVAVSLRMSVDEALGVVSEEIGLSELLLLHLLVPVEI